jgi:Protein of unknown function (DUF1810)
MAEYYGISTLAEARAYLAHPVLGARLDLCTRTVRESDPASLHAIFGSPDDTKFRSWATLFAVAAGEEDPPFRRTLDRWCDGRPDDRTLALISRRHFSLHAVGLGATLEEHITVAPLAGTGAVLPSVPNNIQKVYSTYTQV